MSAYKGMQIPPGVHPVISELIRARKDQNLSQGVLAERLGVSQGTVCRWESGQRDVAFADVSRWAAVLGLVLYAGEPVIPDGPLPELVAGGLA